MQNNNSWTRRQFLSTATGAAASLALAGNPSNAWAATAVSPLRGRFLTHVSVVRVNQIEVTPTHSIGEDEVGRQHSGPHPLAAGSL